MPLPELKQIEALQERIEIVRIFNNENILNYLNLVNEINFIKINHLMTNPLDNHITNPLDNQQRLQRLRNQLLIKYSTVKTNFQFIKLFIELLNEEIIVTNNNNSQFKNSIDKAQILKKIMLTKRKIDELKIKKFEILEINKKIELFNNNKKDYQQIFKFSINELKEIFNEKFNDIEKYLIKIDDDDDDDDDNNNNNNNNKEITYQFKANLTNSVSKLNEIQKDLNSKINHYKFEINEIKKNYNENLVKFDKIKQIAGLKDDMLDINDNNNDNNNNNNNDNNDNNDNNNNEDQEQDLEMKDS